MAFDVEQIEKRIDRAITAGTEVSVDAGGLRFTDFGQVLEFAKAMATAGVAIPAHLRGNPGACLGICTQAFEWRMSPFAVANKSYVANDRLAYESQLIHAVVEARSPLKSRLRHEIIGEGDERRCRVWGTFKGETEPHSYTSEALGKLRDARGRNDRGTLKGSPLWETQPETQLFYSASRTWARMFCPDVLLGIYSVDELPDEEPRDVTSPTETQAELTARLKKNRKARARGFDADHVDRETTALRDGANVIDGTAERVEPKHEPEPEQLDIETEAKLAAAFEAGKAAETGTPGPAGYSDAEKAKWIEGYLSIDRELKAPE